MPFEDYPTYLEKNIKLKKLHIIKIIQTAPINVYNLA